MKCPKCGYLGFDHVDRCRNCGYDFSLTSVADAFELPLKTAAHDDARRPLEDLALLDEAVASQGLRVSGSIGSGAVHPGQERGIEPGATPSPEVELPLFGAAISDDVPLITKAPAPRPPLAVRRATPDVARLRTVSPRTATLDFESPDSAVLASRLRGSSRQHAATTNHVEEDASAAARLAAGVTDLLILAAIDVAVVYLTMQICGIGLEDLGVVLQPALFAFLLVQNGGYLVIFTAGGQTLGKMASGIRVVSTEPRSPLDFGRAFVREAIWFVLAAPGGLGFLTLFSRDRRGVHDRFAGTRVVRG
jgi:uncharacterized RDD family membrane protein YckC